MTDKEFRKALARLDWTYEWLAAHLRLNPKTPAHWWRGTHSVPEPVADWIAWHADHRELGEVERMRQRPYPEGWNVQSSHRQRTFREKLARGFSYYRTEPVPPDEPAPDPAASEQAETPEASPSGDFSDFSDAAFWLFDPFGGPAKTPLDLPLEATDEQIRAQAAELLERARREHWLITDGQQGMEAAIRAVLRAKRDAPGRGKPRLPRR